MLGSAFSWTPFRKADQRVLQIPGLKVNPKEGSQALGAQWLELLLSKGGVETPPSLLRF